jgi:tRNA1Val (adenine37-N6)-methyltransferase
MSRSGTHFHFKQFSIRHDHSTMKVGTDGVLLGAWVNVEGCKRILDIGTGSGVIAVMLAQRTSPDTHIEGIEIEQRDAEQARENAAQSPWANRISIHHSSLQAFQPPERFDLVVSNPPYFNNSQKPPDKKRIAVRHTTLLPFPVLLDHAKKMMNARGRFAVVLPFNEGNEFILLANTVGLYCVRKDAFRTRKEKPVERWLLEFSTLPSNFSEGEILLYDAGLEWSSEYIRLTGDFYLGR